MVSPISTIDEVLRPFEISCVEVDSLARSSGTIGPSKCVARPDCPQAASVAGKARSPTCRLRLRPLATQAFSTARFREALLVPTRNRRSSKPYNWRTQEIGGRRFG